MSDLKLGILLWSQARDLAGDARRRAAGRPARLRPPLDVGPPLRDLRRPVPADLRGLVAARRLGHGDGADTARPARRRQHVPQPGPRRQDRRDARPRQRRPGDPGHRRGVDGASSTRPTASISGPASASASTGSMSPSPRCARVLDGESVTSAPGGHYAFDDLRHQPAPGPEAPADHDRRQRREEDAPDGRPLRRHVERDGPARGDAPQDRGPPAATATPSGATSPRSSSRSASRSRSATPRPRPIGSGRPRWSTTGRRSPTSRTTTRSGTARPSRSPSSSGRTSSSASGPSSPSSRRRTTSRRSSGSSARSSRWSTPDG